MAGLRRLDRSDGAAVDDVLGSGDGRSSVADEEDDEFGDFFGFGRPSEWDTAERSHQLVERGVAGSVTVVRDPFDEPFGRRRANESGRDAVDPNPEWGDLGGQALAVGR